MRLATTRFLCLVSKKEIHKPEYLRVKESSLTTYATIKELANIFLPK